MFPFVIEMLQKFSKPDIFKHLKFYFIIKKMWRTYSDIMSPIKQPQWNRSKITQPYLRDRQKMLEYLREMQSNSFASYGEEQLGKIRKEQQRLESMPYNEEEWNELNRQAENLTRETAKAQMSQVRSLSNIGITMGQRAAYKRLRELGYEEKEILNNIKHLENIREHTLNNIGIASDLILNNLPLNVNVRDKRFLNQLEQEISGFRTDLGDIRAELKNVKREIENYYR